MQRAFVLAVGLALMAVGLIYGSRIYYFDDRSCGSVLSRQTTGVTEYDSDHCDPLLHAASPAVYGLLALGLVTALTGLVWLVVGTRADRRNASSTNEPH